MKKCSLVTRIKQVPSNNSRVMKDLPPVALFSDIHSDYWKGRRHTAEREKLQGKEGGERRKRTRSELELCGVTKIQG